MSTTGRIGHARPPTVSAPSVAATNNATRTPPKMRSATVGMIAGAADQASKAGPLARSRPPSSTASDSRRSMSGRSWATACWRATIEGNSAGALSQPARTSRPIGVCAVQSN